MVFGKELKRSNFNESLQPKRLCIKLQCGGGYLLILKLSQTPNGGVTSEDGRCNR